MDHAAYCDALEREVARVSALVRDVDPATPVPTCPGWDIGKMTKHLGTAHRWSRYLVANHCTEAMNTRALDLELPPDRGDYPEWLEQGGNALVATLRDADPNEPVWAWGADRHVRFWSRRMYYETLLHGADAAFALGREPSIEQSAAVDGIDELLENLDHVPGFGERYGALGFDGESVHLHSTDAEGEWMINLGTGDFGWEHGHGKGTVAVRGTAEDLLLLVYHRRQHDDSRYATFGDTTLLGRWLESTTL
jgi:uncharacterized protein (TIGR03083 family)